MNKEPCYICWMVPRKNYIKCNECTSTLCSKCYQNLKRDDSPYYYKCLYGHIINKEITNNYKKVDAIMQIIAAIPTYLVIIAAVYSIWQL